MKKFIITSITLLVALITNSQEYQFIETFDYDNYSYFRNETNYTKFLFDWQLESIDLDGSGLIENKESIKGADITGNALKITLKMNSYDSADSDYATTLNTCDLTPFPGTANGCYGKYLRRCELVYSHEGVNQKKITSGDEFWYGFKINPDQFLFEENAANHDIVSQILIGNWYFENSAYDWWSGEDWVRGPVFSVGIEENKWMLKYATSIDAEKVKIPLDDVILNEWTEFKVQLKLSDSNSAFVKVWKNGVIVLDESGFQNAPQEGIRYNFKVGDYKPNINTYSGEFAKMQSDDSTTDHIILFDDLWLGQYDLSSLVDGLKLVEEDCPETVDNQTVYKTVDVDDPFIHLVDVTRDSPYIVKIRNTVTLEDEYFESETASFNLLEKLPNYLQSNTLYRINARINGHPLFNDYATTNNCREFKTGDLSLRLVSTDCSKTMNNQTVYKTVDVDDPFIHLVDVTRDSPYIVKIRNTVTLEDEYFESETASFNLLEKLPNYLQSNTLYRINARINGHPLFNDYATTNNCREFKTGDLSLRLVSTDCSKTMNNQTVYKTVDVDDPFIHLVDVTRDSPYIVKIRNTVTLEDEYFESETASFNLLEKLPNYLQSNTLYRINARINGHPLFNDYATTNNCREFKTGDLSLRLVSTDCSKTMNNQTVYKTVDVDDPFIHLVDVTRDSPYIVKIRNTVTLEDEYFESETASFNLLEKLPNYLQSNTLYRINARINGHPLFNDYATTNNCREFKTGDDIIPLDEQARVEQYKEELNNPKKNESNDYVIVYDLLGNEIFSNRSSSEVDWRKINLFNQILILRTNKGTQKLLIAQ